MKIKINSNNNKCDKTGHSSAAIEATVKLYLSLSGAYVRAGGASGGAGGGRVCATGGWAQLQRACVRRRRAARRRLRHGVCPQPATFRACEQQMALHVQQSSRTRQLEASALALRDEREERERHDSAFDSPGAYELLNW